MSTAWFDVPQITAQSDITDTMSVDSTGEYNIVTAHAPAECGNKGECDRSTGICICDQPWEGPGCSRMGCPNGCNGHGTCTTMGDAAKTFDGFFLNHTTTYDEWDANLNMGCVCDQGYEGYDCALRRFSRGPNPLDITTSAKPETVKLFCECADVPCSDEITLSFDGGKTRPIPPTTNSDGLKQILVDDISGILGYSNRYLVNPSTAIDVSTNGNSYLCQAVATTVGGTTTVTQLSTNTTITFLSKEGDLPAMMVETQKSTTRAYFVTEQNLTCTCDTNCYGTFLLEFDGLRTREIAFDATAMDIRNALVGLKTLSYDPLKDGYVMVNPDFPADEAFCVAGETRMVEIVIRHRIGNLPHIIPVPSLGFKGRTEGNAMTVLTNDGSSSAAICNGQGFANCKNESANCSCTPGFEASDLGECGSIAYHTSSWAGLERCPGTVDYNLAPIPVHHVIDTAPLVYFMDNGANKSLYMKFRDESQRTSIVAETGPHAAKPGIGSFNAKDISREYSSAYSDLHRNLTNGTQAGCALDATKQRLYFVDHSMRGIRSISTNGSDVLSLSWMRQSGPDMGGFSHARKGYTGSDLRSFVDADTTGFDGSKTLDQLALDLRMDQRMMYFTDPGVRGEFDGKIYAVNLDGETEVTDLTPTIGQTKLRDPLGIAVDLKRDYLYWVDGVGNYSVGGRINLKKKDIFAGRLWRCELNGRNSGGNVELVYGNFSSPQGLALDLDNYTAYITDVGTMPDSSVWLIGMDWHLDNKEVMGKVHDWPWELDGVGNVNGKMFKNVSGPYKMQDKAQLVGHGREFQKTFGLRFPYDIQLDYVDKRYYISDSDLGIIGWGPMQCVTCDYENMYIFQIHTNSTAKKLLSPCVRICIPTSVCFH